MYNIPSGDVNVPEFVGTAFDAWAAQDTDVDQPDREHDLVGPAPRATYQTYTRKHDPPTVARNGSAVLEEAVNRVKAFAGIAQVITTIEAEHAEPMCTSTKKAA